MNNRQVNHISTHQVNLTINDGVIMTFQLGRRSLDNLKGVNESLVNVVKRAIEISETDFTVTEGVRTIERQRELVAKGASKTMNSYHIPNARGGRAIDIYPYYNGRVQVHAPHTEFRKIAKAMKEAANELGVSITWGGDWKSFCDLPHYQIEMFIADIGTNPHDAEGGTRAWPT